jgi:hypothetical protein
MNKPTNQSCSNCGAAFLCLVENSCVTCWCYDFPVVHVSDVKKDCMCPSCLERSLQFQKDSSTEKASTKIVTNKKLD